MSNRASIRLTRFTNLNRDGTDGEAYYGVRTFDDYGSTYLAAFDSPEELLAMSDRELVEMARDVDEGAAAIIGFAEEDASGICIFDDWMEWEEIPPA